MRTTRWLLTQALPWLLFGVSWLASCSPTVKMQAPKEPITINLNIKLDADVRVRLEEAARQDIKENPDIFGAGLGEGGTR